MNLQFCKQHAYKEKPKKVNANLIKYQVENCPVLPGRNLISTCNRDDDLSAEESDFDCDLRNRE